MEGDTALEYATLRIFPSQNSYEAFVCGAEGVEKLVTGSLESILPHLPGIRDLNARGTNATFKLQVTGDLKNSEWFNKSTLNRFLQIVGSPDLVNATKVIEGEMSQLEESRKFHLSLYAEGSCNDFESEQADDCNSVETAPKLEPQVKIASSDASKNQLLQAMDLRLAALKGELAAATNEAVSSATCSTKEVTHLLKFCDYFRATHLMNSLQKRLELIQESETATKPNNKSDPIMRCTPSLYIADNANEHTQKSEPVYSETLVKFGVSPALVAQVERQSSSESEGSFDSSGDEDQTSAERRSRTSTRFAPPRRSASPMRRVQLGRSGSRRATAITIRNLSYPVRDRASFSSPRDVIQCDKEEEGCEETRKPESNVTRMSVQDAISLFESKQKPQNQNAQKHSSTDKSVLRRWSGSVPLPNNGVNEGNSKHLVEDKMDPDTKCEGNVELDPSETTHNLIDHETDSAQNQRHESNEVSSKNETRDLQGNFEESEKIEAESSHITSKKRAAKNLLVRSRQPQSSENPYRGGFYEQYKEKRDKKLRADNDGKRAEQEAQLRLMQQILDEKKAKISSKKNRIKDVAKFEKPKTSIKEVSKIEKTVKNQTQAPNSRKEIPKASFTKKTPSKTSALSATRKSWPSTLPSKVANSKSSPPSKTPVGASSLGKLKPSVPRSSAKGAMPQQLPPPLQQNVKEMKTDNMRTVKVAKEKKKQTNTTESEKHIMQKKVTRVSGDSGGTVPSKPSVYNKFTKKSSVVPLESKQASRDKVPRRSPTVTVSNFANKAKIASQESSVNCESKLGTETKSTMVNATEQVLDEQNNQDIAPFAHSNTTVELDPLANNHVETDDFNEFEDKADCSPKVSSQEQEESREQPPVLEPHDQVLHHSNSNSTFEEKELDINPAAWQEIVEQEQVQDKPQLSDKTTRVRHSLSQMLQEDHNEPDPIEWGTAENAPALIFQKDSSPKGLKRLLKFARKGKGGDANVTGWSSPSAFSEGEEDGEECKSLDKRSADYSPRKVSLLHSKNNGQKKTSFSAQSNVSKCIVDKPNHVSATASTTKGTRSFFSLSAFRGSRSEETKFH